MTIFAIDPGPTNSGVVHWHHLEQQVIWADAAVENHFLLDLLRMRGGIDLIACECIEALYAHVGKETVRTIRFCGRIEEAAYTRNIRFVGMSPQEVKKLVCGTSSAKDPAVRQALIDRLGPPGTKKTPGRTYGVSSHAWRALAVAIATQEMLPNAIGEARADSATSPKPPTQ